jgi:hypothetical protein
LAPLVRPELPVLELQVLQVLVLQLQHQMRV